MAWTTLVCLKLPASDTLKPESSLQAIAIDTFARVWWRIGVGRKSLPIAYAVVGLIWTYEILFVFISAWHFDPNTFYHPTPVCCTSRPFCSILILFVESIGAGSANITSSRNSLASISRFGRLWLSRWCCIHRSFSSVKDLLRRTLSCGGGSAFTPATNKQSS